MPEIEVRPIAENDIEALSDFEHSFYSEYVWQMSLDVESGTINADFRQVRLPRRVFVSYPRKKEAIFSDLKAAEAFLVAGVGNRPVGYVKVMADDNDPHVARVTDLVVPTQMRRQGIASGLLLAVMDLLAHRHFHTLLLEAQSKNYPAIKMAEKLGFNFCGYRDHYFPSQELAMFFSRFVR
jgi:ribosomal protein S18 acetylase RimI-like enzyme